MITDPDGKEHLAYGNEVWHSSVNPGYQQNLRLNSFLMERKVLNISYCWIHKVASTSLQTLFMKLENNSKYLDEDKPYQTMYRMAPKSSKEFAEISKSFYNFVIVRHPFSRLVSAYKDRVKGCRMKGEWYMKVAAKLSLSGDPDCYVEIDTGKIKLNKAKNKLEIARKGVIVPSFQQFVQVLLATEVTSYNQHWVPYYIQCTPCIANLSGVARLERREEVEYVLGQAGGLGKLEWRNKTPGKKDEKSVTEYFQTLQCDEVRGLIKKFWLDFVLFEYDHWQFVERCWK